MPTSPQDPLKSSPTTTQNQDNIYEQRYGENSLDPNEKIIIRVSEKNYHGNIETHTKSGVLRKDSISETEKIKLIIRNRF